MDELLKSLSESCSQLSRNNVELKRVLEANKDDVETAQIVIKSNDLIASMLAFEKDLMAYVKTHPSEPTLDVSNK